jgi:hypothetical protein
MQRRCLVGFIDPYQPPILTSRRRVDARKRTWVRRRKPVEEAARAVACVLYDH